MRLRWTIIPVLFVAAVIAVYNVCHVEGGPVDTIVGMARRITYGALYAVGFWTASFVLRKWMTQQARAIYPPAYSPTPPLPPIPTFEIDPQPTGPGQYRVRGVDLDSHFEITEVVYADSPSSAQLKVELKGVRVGAVEPADR